MTSGAALPIFSHDFGRKVAVVRLGRVKLRSGIVKAQHMGPGCASRFGRQRHSSGLGKQGSAFGCGSFSPDSMAVEPYPQGLPFMCTQIHTYIHTHICIIYIYKYRYKCNIYIYITYVCMYVCIYLVEFGWTRHCFMKPFATCGSSVLPSARFRGGK